MTKKITIEEALKLVEFEYIGGLGWCVTRVNGDVCGCVEGTVYGNVGRVHGTVKGDIGSNEWQRIEKLELKLRRLIASGVDKKQLEKALDQLENNQ